MYFQVGNSAHEKYTQLLACTSQAADLRTKTVTY